MSKRLLFIIAVLLFVSAGAFAQVGGYSSTATDTTGKRLSLPTVKVCADALCATTATIYKDAAKTALSNPFTGDAQGNYSFYAAPGNYFAQVAKTGFATLTSPFSIGGDSSQTGNNTFSGSNVFTGSNLHSGPETFAGTTSVPAPINPTDASTKSYVDATLVNTFPPTQVQNFATTSSYTISNDPITSPATRYTTSVDANGYFNVAQTYNGVFSVGARTQIARRVGRVYTVVATFTTTGFDVSNSGVELGFDTSNTTGTYQTYGSTAVSFDWRSNGSLTAYKHDVLGLTPMTGVYPTTCTVAAPSFAAGDILTMAMTENVDGTASFKLTKRTTTNTTSTGTCTITSIPAGWFFGAIRQLAPAATTATGTIQRLMTNDPIPQPPTITVPTPTAVVLPFAQPALASGIALGVSADANAFTNRAVPPGFATLPVLPAIVRGPGDVVMTQSVLSAFVQQYGTGLTNIAYVNASTGSDTTGAINDATKPYASISKPVRNTGAQVIVVQAGTYDTFDYRSTDTGAGAAKMVLCQVPGTCILRELGGDTIATNTWTNTGTGGVYSTPIASFATETPQRVLYTDTNDARGYPARLRKFLSLAALQSGGTGWFYDSSAHVLYVALGGSDLTVSATAARIRALYLDPTTGYARVLIYGAKLALYGFYMDGVSPVVWEFNNAGTEIASEYWGQNNTILFAPLYGHESKGSKVYSQNERIHASQSDGFNYDAGFAPGCLSSCSPSPTGNIAVGEEIGAVVTDAGDQQTLNAADYLTTYGAPNANGSSSHTGMVARFGVDYEGSFGPEVADTSASGFTDMTWIVGSITRTSDPNAFPNGNYGGITITGVASGDSGNRKAWLDTNYTGNEHDRAFRFETFVTIKKFNNTQDVADSTFATPTITSYTPDAP